MENLTKPRLAVLWDVEVGEPFTIVHKGREFTDLTLSQEGYVLGDVPIYVIFDAINDPDRVYKQVRLTEAELAICKALGAKWLTKSNRFALNAVHMWSQKPEERINGEFYGDDIWIGCVNGALMRSVHYGACICVEEAGK